MKNQRLVFLSKQTSKTISVKLIGSWISTKAKQKDLSKEKIITEKS
jgi:hypothetical protein